MQPQSIQALVGQYSQLPASQIALKVNSTLAAHTSLVVTAPPGAGKSTLLPLTLLMGREEWGSDSMAADGRILMLEPRRLAARQIAARMAAMIGEPVGRTVGYRVRQDCNVSAATRVEVLTEGILTRMLIDDPTLEGVSAVVFDEFHERSIHSDLALALSRQTQRIVRPDLRLIVMSATIDTDALCRELEAPLVESGGRMFPVEVNHSTEDLTAPYTQQSVAQSVARAICRMHREHEGDILAFLPGQGEIERCRELLGDSLASTAVCPLYGNLSPEQQHRAIAPTREGERKVVLATPIAETSLTIEGVRAVVDSGLCRQLVFDPRTGLSHLETARISLDRADQRSGRAGRVTAGTCLRLWTLTSEHRMEPQRQPELLDADLTQMVLSIAAFGENDVEALPWLTLPPRGNVVKARLLLQRLGAIDEAGNITPMGRKMAVQPCHPRIARMIVSAKTQEEKLLAHDLADLLEDKDPLASDPTAGIDITLRISRLRRQQKRRDDVSPSAVGALIARAYPERIARAIDAIGTYRLASGDQVRIDTSDPLTARDWLAVASLHTAGGTGRVFLAAPLQPEDIETTPYDHLSWNSKEGCVVMQREERIGQLVVSSKPLQDAAPAEIVRIVCEAARKEGRSMFCWDDTVQALQRRVAQVAAWHPEMQLPDLSTDHLLQTAGEWLPFYLQQGHRIKSTAAELKKLDLKEILWALIPYEQQGEVDRLAPTHLQMPTGHRIRIDYRQGAAAPVLSVKLQECFGMAETPCINGGKQPLLMELLSPGFKPVQLTQDLANFWKTTYYEVRKELKRRYPKHQWPEKV